MMLMDCWGSRVKPSQFWMAKPRLSQPLPLIERRLMKMGRLPWLIARRVFEKEGVRNSQSKKSSLVRTKWAELKRRSTKLFWECSKR